LSKLHYKSVEFCQILECQIPCTDLPSTVCKPNLKQIFHEMITAPQKLEQIKLWKWQKSKWSYLGTIQCSMTS